MTYTIHDHGAQTSMQNMDNAYTKLRKLQQERFNDLGKRRLFVVEGDDLFDSFIRKLPLEFRQHYTCHACRRFFDKHAGLVWIDEHGKREAVLWPTPGDLEKKVGRSPFAAAVKRLRDIVMRRPVAHQFFSWDDVYGTPSNWDHKRGYDWSHFSLIPQNPHTHKPRSRLQTVGQAEAQSIQDHGMFQRGLAEYSTHVIKRAVGLLESGVLARANEHKARAEWTLALSLRHNRARSDRAKTDILWNAVGQAGTGWANIKTSALSTLFDAIAAGYSDTTVKRKWGEVVHPLKYQRPTAPPKAGNIAMAAKVVQELGLERAFDRRFAMMSDLVCAWQGPMRRAPSHSQNSLGPFEGIQPRDQRPIRRAGKRLPARTMTFAKFRRDVMPKARRIEMHIGYGRESYGALVTAADPTAPPLIQWDHEDYRCPVTWYLRYGGSWHHQWGLTSGLCEVKAIVDHPATWRTGEMRGDQQSSWFILEGCHDTKPIPGGGIFPQLLKTELHGARATIEAHSNRSMVLPAPDGEPACGLMVAEGSGWRSVRLRVETDLGVSEITLDRWD